MKNLTKIINLALLTISLQAYADSNTNSSTPAASKSTCVPGMPKSSQNYDATKWYRDSAEKIAQYNQVFSIGEEKIKAIVSQKHLKKGQWGVIFDIDETVLDNSEYEKRTILSCGKYSESTMYSFMEEELSIATPGASNLTCSIQKMGGRVILITNRNGSFDNKIQPATIANLKKTGICFDNVLFAKEQKDDDKNPRFEAAQKGNYTGITSFTKLPPLKIVAYFGDNIQDFPMIKQQNAIQQDPNGAFYKKFGQEYFSLPNPTYGSWQANQFN